MDETLVDSEILIFSRGTLFFKRLSLYLNMHRAYVPKFKIHFFYSGALITIGFLGVGLKSMYDGNRVKSQMMMRGRIAAQGFTVVAILGGLFYQGMKVINDADDNQVETVESVLK